MTNRINGDFDSDSIEAFRAAYAAQILEPEDQEVDPYTGLPTELVLNTSPWIQHTGLWKANDGTNKDFVPNQVLVEGETQEDFEDESEEDLEITAEQIDALLTELEDRDLSDSDLELIESLLADEGGDYFEESLDDDDTLTDEEIENLLEELRLDSESEDDQDEESEGISDEEIDALIAEIEAEFEEEE